MGKSPDAFRTISEVAEWLDRPAHVLRFWESKFSQIKPVKRAGGRRYYRPQDMLLLGGIKKLLHDEGMTIKGVQKVLREHGVKHVADLSDPLDDTFAYDAPGYPHGTDASAGSSIDVPEDTPQGARVLTFPREGQPQQPATKEKSKIRPVEAEAETAAPPAPAPQAPDEAQDTPAPVAEKHAPTPSEADRPQDAVVADDTVTTQEAPAQTSRAAQPPTPPVDTPSRPAPAPSAPTPSEGARPSSLCATIAALKAPIDAKNSARVRTLLDQLIALYAPTEYARKE